MRLHSFYLHPTPFPLLRDGTKVFLRPHYTIIFNSLQEIIDVKPILAYGSGLPGQTVPNTALHWHAEKHVSRRLYPLRRTASTTILNTLWRKGLPVFCPSPDIRRRGGTGPAAGQSVPCIARLRALENCYSVLNTP
jgi:hypothetical protein